MDDYWSEFGKVALAHALAVASPGPDFALVLKQSLQHGRRLAIWTSIGVGSAILLHITYSLLGLGLLIRSSESWFNAMKFIGAAYIAWLGVQSLRAKPRRVAQLGGGGGETSHATPTARSAWARGFLTNALNPKATMFFISLFVMLIDPRTPKIVQAGYGVWMALATAAWFACVAIIFTGPEVRARFLRQGHWIERALGVVFLGFALSLAVATFK